MKTKVELKRALSEMLLANRGKELEGGNLSLFRKALSMCGEYYRWYADKGDFAVRVKRNPDWSYWSDSFFAIYPNGEEYAISIKNIIKNIQKEDISKL